MAKTINGNGIAASGIERARNAMQDLASTSRTLHEAVGQFRIAEAAA